MNAGLCTDKLLPDCLSFLFCVFIIPMALMKNHKCSMRTDKLIKKINTQLAYPWLYGSQSIPWECIRTIMHYTIIVIRHSETGDYACWICKEIVFPPWWRTENLLYTFTVFTQSQNNTILYRFVCWKFNFLAVQPAKMAVRCKQFSKINDLLPG